MLIQDLILYSAFIIIAIAIWQHLNVSLLAREAVARYIQQQELLLLDQSVILKRMRLRRSTRSLFTIERHYIFEFSTVADTRYSGEAIFWGKHLKHIELPPHRIN